MIGLGTSAASDGPSIDLRRPGIGGTAAIGEVHHGGPELLVARPAEHGQLAFAGLPGRRGRSSQGREGVIGGKPFPAIPDLGQQGGRPHHPRSWQCIEDVLVGMRVEELRDLLFAVDGEELPAGHLIVDLRDRNVQRIERGIPLPRLFVEVGFGFALALRQRQRLLALRIRRAGLAKLQVELLQLDFQQVAFGLNAIALQHRDLGFGLQLVLEQLPLRLLTLHRQ